MTQRLHPEGTSRNGFAATVRSVLAILLLTLVPVLADAYSDNHSLARFLHSSSSLLDIPETDGDGEKFDNQKDVLADPDHPRNGVPPGRRYERSAGDSAMPRAIRFALRRQPAPRPSDP